MTHPPCKDCTDRVLGCHSGCGKYLAYHQYQSEVLKTKRIENDIVGYCKKSALKLMFGHPESIKAKLKRRNGAK